MLIGMFATFAFFGIFFLILYYQDKGQQKRRIKVGRPLGYHVWVDPEHCHNLSTSEQGDLLRIVKQLNEENNLGEFLALLKAQNAHLELSDIDMMITFRNKRTGIIKRNFRLNFLGKPKERLDMTA